jgi:DnaJ-class molecular chaperone
MIKEKIRAMLKDIKCPSCYGSGKSPDPYDPPDEKCFGCKGTGIHHQVLAILEVLDNE